MSDDFQVKILVRTNINEAAEKIKEQLAKIEAKNVKIKIVSNADKAIEKILLQYEKAGKKISEVYMAPLTKTGEPSKSSNLYKLQSSMVDTNKEAADEKKREFDYQKALGAQMAKDIAAEESFLKKKEIYLSKDPMTKASSFLKQAGSRGAIQTPEVLAGVETAKKMKDIFWEMKNAPGLDNKKLQEYRTELERLAEELPVVEKETKSTGGAQASFSDKVKQTIETFIRYQVALRLIYFALNQIKEGIQYVKELDKEMTNIRIVTGMSQESADKLAKSYNQLGKEMSVSTLEITRGSLEFLRQGKTAEETALLIKNSTMMSKLGNMEAAKSSEALTAVMNGFNMTAYETTGVVDKLVALDNNYATSVEEIATAMKYASSSSKMVGIDFDHLAAYIAIISSKTRLPAESIGQSLKTVEARMTAIKNLKAFDEEGQAINDVEDSLKSVGISLRKGTGEFRDMQDVIDEIAKKWDTMDRTEQIFIAQKIGGTRQYDKILALLDSHVQLQKALTEEQNSTNLSTERYAIFQQGIEAAQNRMIVEWEKFMDNPGTKEVVVGFYNMVTAMLEAVNAAGGLKTVLQTLIPILVLYQAQTKSAQILNFFSLLKNVGLAAAGADSPLKNFALNIKDIATIGFTSKTSMQLLKLSFKNLTTEFIAGLNPVTVYAAAILSLIGVVVTYYETINKVAKEGQKNFSDILTQQTQDITKNIGTENAPSSADVFKKFQQTIGATKSGGGAFNFFFAKDVYDMQIKALNQYLELLARTSKSQQEYAGYSEKALAELGMKVDENGKVYMQSSNGVRKYVDEVKYYNKNVWDAIHTTDSFDRAQRNVNSGVADTQYSVEQLAKAYGSLSDSVKEYQDAYSGIDALIEKSIQGKLEFADLANLPSQYEQAIQFENGQLSLNISLLKEKELETLRNQRIQAEAAKAGEDVLALYDYQIKTIEDGMQKTHGAFQLTSWDNEKMLNQIANMAGETGYAFQDMQGNALNSAQAIYSYISQGTVQFNDFVNQIANATGMNVNQIMTMIRAMVGGTSAYVAAQTGAMFNAASFGGVMKDLKTNVSAGAFGAGGGGGGGGKSKEQDRIEKEIKKIEEKKNALKDLIDEYKKYIDTQKEILKNQKDEKEFTDELMKKNQSLAKIKSEIAILALDDSEEAKAKRIKLEEDAAQLEQDITKSNEDRKYELQVQALDNAQQAYEDKINAQMDLLDKQISKLNETKDAISGGGGVGGAVSSLGNTFTNVFNSQIMPSLKGFGELTDEQKKKVMELGNVLFNQGVNADALLTRIQNLIDYYNGAMNWLGVTPISSPGAKEINIKQHHSGGFVGLNSNEEFAKLLKGEYVVTEGQMENFMKNILPKIANYPSFTGITGSGDISVSMPINVAGSLDEKVLPSIEKIAEKVVKQINESMKNRGYIRATNLTSI